MTGRPQRKLTDAQKAEVETLAAVLSQSQVADYLGISQDTFQRMLDRDPELLRRYKTGKARAIQDVASGLLMAAREGDRTAQIFFLKTQAGWRETQGVAVEGVKGAKFEIEFIDPAPPATGSDSIPGAV